MGGNMGSTSATNSDARVKLGVPTSSRTSLPARIEIAVPLGRESLWSSTHLILAAIARTSESANVVPGRDDHHDSSRALVGRSAGYRAVYTSGVRCGESSRIPPETGNRPDRGIGQADGPLGVPLLWALPFGGSEHSLGVATAAGFASLETMGYAFVSLLGSKGNLSILDEVLLVRGLSSPAGHMSWTDLVCAVLWRVRLKVWHATLNWRVGNAFLMAIILHAPWDTFASIRSVTFVELLDVAFLSLLMALVGLVFLIRRVREAARRPGSTHPGRAASGGEDRGAVW